MPKHTVASEPVTSILPPDVVIDPESEGSRYNADDEVLAALGYKAEFKREFSLFTTFCVSFAVLGLLPSFASTLFYGMGYAGTAGRLELFFFCFAWGLGSREGVVWKSIHHREEMRKRRMGGRRWKEVRERRNGRGG